MKNEITLSDAMCRIQQAQTILSMWLETLTTDDDSTPDMVGSLLTILNGIPDAIAVADEELGDFVLRQHTLDALRTEAAISPEVAA